MGICLSCLRPEEDEENPQLGERTPLLGQNTLKQEEIAAENRQKELDTIVSDLTENLIDVTTFLQAPDEGEVEETGAEEEAELQHEAPKQLPFTLMTEDHKRSLRQISQEVSTILERELTVNSVGALVLDFGAD
ncbi:hypothetical protein BABINDRAFT_11695 [Babjeviella inositovora NRRL Y-12698]|uniref:Uncharacterized protein n=1 Tax=Babjeviella inositovora NRRL Y-12698 TaxID=984486 RepID=A0A1E3QV73_9ASCO|nr:uncharacterized protein BABINDRAFT_11695 [Babjeviella inositovora NRRL Y-12698]ODQ81568.1 hypothetical protein BABINDRAFT_11695 [Babjeviella inositovora NRRL Y-12698]